MVIDVFTKYGWLVTLKITTVANAFREVFADATHSRLCTDKGTEFYNQQLKAVLKANNLILCCT